MGRNCVKLTRTLSAICSFARPFTSTSLKRLFPPSYFACLETVTRDNTHDKVMTPPSSGEPKEALRPQGAAGGPMNDLKGPSKSIRKQKATLMN